MSSPETSRGGRMENEKNQEDGRMDGWMDAASLTVYPITERTAQSQKNKRWLM